MARKAFTQTCYECGKKVKYGTQVVVEVNGYFYIYCAEEGKVAA